MLLLDRVRSVDDFQGKNTDSWTLSVKTRPEFHFKKRMKKEEIVIAVAGIRRGFDIGDLILILFVLNQCLELCIRQGR